MPSEHASINSDPAHALGLQRPGSTPDDASPLIVNRLVDGRRLVAVAEPTVWSEDGVDLAAATLSYLVDCVAPEIEVGRDSIERILSAGLAETNDWLLAQLRDWTGFVPERRVGVGLGVAVMAPEVTVFALVAPSQAVVWQSGRRYDVPPLASWLGAVESLGAAPLGLSPEVSPTIARTRAHLDDVVMVMSSATARGLGELERRGDLPRSPDGVLAVIEEHYADGAFGREGQCLVAVGSSAPSGRFERSRRHLSQAASDLSFPTWIAHPLHRPPHEQAEWSAAASAAPLRGPRRARPIPRLSRRAKWASLVLVVLLLLGGVGLAFDRGSAEEPPENPNIVEARDAVAAAERSSRAGDIDRLLSEAEMSLVRAEEDGVVAADLDPLYVEIQTLRDRVDHQARLGPIELLGRLPGNDDSRARLTLHGEELYVLDDALYRFDLDDRTLIRELAPGDAIDGVTAGPFRDLASDQSTLMLNDGAGIFWRGKDGVWHATALAQPLADGDGRGELFDGNYYWLDPAGSQVLRFASEAYGDRPGHWIEDGNDVDLGKAVDMAVDGHVIILQPNGTVLDLYKGHVVAEERLTLDGADSQALALARPRDGDAIYVVLDAVNGAAVLRIEATTGDRVPYLPTARGDPAYDPTDGETLRETVELVVDEPTGTAYLIADGAIWVTTL